jgi:hypothetical protein
MPQENLLQPSEPLLPPWLPLSWLLLLSLRLLLLLPAAAALVSAAATPMAAAPVAAAAILTSAAPALCCCCSCHRRAKSLVFFPRIVPCSLSTLIKNIPTPYQKYFSRMQRRSQSFG